MPNVFPHDILRRIRALEHVVGINDGEINAAGQSVFFTGTPLDAYILQYATVDADGNATVPAWVVNALSGDATLDSQGALTLSSTGVTANTYGSASLVPVFTVDAKGRISAVTDTAISVPTAPSLFGDGSDSGTTTISGSTTLTRDMFYDVLHVTSSGTLHTANFRVFCKTSCTVDAGGSINVDGPDGATGAGGGAGGVAVPAGSLFGGGSGGNGNVGGNGNPGTGTTASFGGDGGRGQDGAFSGGAKGTATQLTAAQGGAHNVLTGLTGAVLVSAHTGIQGGAGGGAGGGGGVAGGGGGAGGGVLLLAAATLVNDGTISANGGNGGSSGAAGGGGGGGGAVLLTYQTKSGSGTVSATGGTKGTGGSLGTNGGGGRAIEFTV